MTIKAKKYLIDIVQAISLIKEFTLGIDSYHRYHKDLKTKSAVERQLGIIGEAVNQLIKLEENIILSNSRKMVDFRNRMIHSYDNLDDSMVWVILQKHIPVLEEEVVKLLHSE